MTFDVTRKQHHTTYTHELQIEHNRYLDMLKQEFIQCYANRPKYNKSVDDFDKIKTLGAGSFGTVFLARDKDNYEYFAMKAIEKAEAIKKKQLKQLNSEKKIMQSVNFPFLIKLEYCCKDNVYLYFVLSYEAGGELYTLIRRVGKLGEPLAQFYAAQITLALEYLHHCSIIHRDVKPENILINESGYVKLADLGFGKLIKNRTWTICGTPEYIAPEIITSKGYSYAVDWWALGILIYEMIAGYPPFCHSEPMKLYAKILAGNFSTPEIMSSSCKSLVKSLLYVDTSKRFGSLKAGVYDIKSHAWFSEIQWSSILYQKTYPPLIPSCKQAGDTSNFPEVADTKLKKSPECLFSVEFKDF